MPQEFTIYDFTSCVVLTVVGTTAFAALLSTTQGWTLKHEVPLFGFLLLLLMLFAPHWLGDQCLAKIPALKQPLNAMRAQGVSVYQGAIGLLVGGPVAIVLGAFYSSIRRVPIWWIVMITVPPFIAPWPFIEPLAKFIYNCIPTVRVHY